MTPKIRAIGAYRPRIDQGQTVQKPELIHYASRATGLVEASFDQSIKELRDQLIGFMRAGRAVKIEGLGTWTPGINLDGGFGVQYRPDNALINELNMPGKFTGKIVNRENIGKTIDQLVSMWNDNNPNDQIAA